MKTRVKKIKINKTKKKMKVMTNITPEIITINNYKILLIPNKNDTIVIKTFINNGFITEDKTTSGINHLLEHILFSAWKKCKNKPCTDYFNNNGIIANATTRNTILTYHVEGLNKNIKLLLEYIISITTNPYIYNELIKKEKHAVLNELLIYSNNYEASLYDKINKNIYNNDGLRYKDDWKIQKDNLKKINMRLLKEVLNKYYTANNIIYVISGDYVKSNIINIFKKLLPKSKNDKINIDRDCFNIDNKKVIIDVNKEVNTGTLYYMFPLKIYIGDDDLFKIEISLNCLKYIIFNNLRYKEKIIYSFFINLDTNICGTLVSLKTNTKCKNIKRIYKLLDKFIEKYKNENISRELLQSQKDKFLYKYINFYNNPHKIADYYGFQYIKQIYNKSKKLYSKEQVKNIILDIELDDIKDIYNKIFNLNSGIKAYQCK